MEDNCGVTSASRSSSKRKHVTLTERFEEREDQENTVVVGNCISETAIVRSGLLSGIEDTEGLASLPSNLSPADVKLWETAYLVETDFPLDELVTVLKVADALGDTNVPAWVTKLVDAVMNTDAKQPQQTEDITCALFRLPPHVLHLVLSSYLERTAHWGRCDLSKALSNLPPALHPAVVSSAAVSGKLELSHHVADKVLLALPSAAIQSPGLMNLRIYNNPGAQYQANIPRSRAALLARAASSHASLTSLSLTSAPLSPQWVRTFSDCLPPGALPSLIDLTLHADAHPGGCAEVAACLRLLPSLTSLTISLHIPPKPVAVPTSLASYARLAANPVSLPYLARLSYSDSVAHGFDRNDSPLGYMCTGQASCAHSFLSLLSAPVLKHLTLHISTRLPMQTFLSQVARFTALEQISFDSNVCPSQLTSYPGSAGPALLPRLDTLTVAASSELMPFSIASAVATLGAAALTRLSLSYDFDYEMVLQSADHGGTLQALRVSEASPKAACEGFFQVLGRCRSLKVLCLGCLVSARHSADRFPSRPLMSALSNLPQLTELLLGSTNRLQLDGHEMARAISSMPKLCSLSLDSMAEMEVAPMQPVLAACGQLKHFTRLIATCTATDVMRAHVTELLTRSPSLQHLVLQRSVLGQDAEQASDALQAQFPNVTLQVMGH